MKAFPTHIATQLREVLLQGENRVEKFIKDRLIMQMIPITQKISKNNFSLLKTVEQGNVGQAHFGVQFMNKLRSAIEHSPEKALPGSKAIVIEATPLFRKLSEAFR